MFNYLSTTIRVLPIEGLSRRASSQPTSTRARSESPIRILNNDTLLNIFYIYRLDFLHEYRSNRGDLVVGQGDQRWWYKLVQVCRLWRYLIHASPSPLDLHLVFTYGVPIADMLAHSSSLPIAIDYRKRGHRMTAEDEEHVLLALSGWHRDRVHRIRLDLPAPNLQKLIMAIDEQFPILESLIIDPLAWTNDDTCLILPTSFQAPHLRHLVLRHAALPMGSPLLTTTAGLVTLALGDIPPSTYFPPNYLLTQLSHMSQLETLVIAFHSPLSNHDVERQMLDTLDTMHITLLNFRVFSFRGVSAYLEALLARINAPVLHRLEVTFFNQLTFVVPHLLQFMQTSENLRYSGVHVTFKKDFVGVMATRRRVPPLYMWIICRHLDWQVASTVQILSALLPALSVVDHLDLHYEGDRLSSERHNEVHRTQWRDFLRPFSNVKWLHVPNELAEELSHSLRSEDGEVPLELLPNLKALVYSAAKNARNAITPLIDERQAAGRPVSLIAVYSCRTCGRSYRNKKALNRHMKDRHLP